MVFLDAVFLKSDTETTAFHQLKPDYENGNRHSSLILFSVLDHASYVLQRSVRPVKILPNTF